MSISENLSLVIMKKCKKPHRYFSIFSFLLAMLSLFFSCSGEPSVPKKTTKPFFDLKAYFNGEIARLANLRGIKKITSVNGRVEERILDSINFEKELEIFSTYDINRPAWDGKYAIDSIFKNQNQLAAITYSATDEKLKTRKIIIDFAKGDVSKITIENSTSSAVAATKQILTYQPSKGYSIENNQKVALVPDNYFLVEVQFPHRLIIGRE